jgi:hypothetical protein
VVRAFNKGGPVGQSNFTLSVIPRSGTYIAVIDFWIQTNTTEVYWQLEDRNNKCLTPPSATYPFGQKSNHPSSFSPIHAKVLVAAVSGEPITLAIQLYGSTEVRDVVLQVKSYVCPLP